MGGLVLDKSLDVGGCRIRSKFECLTEFLLGGLTDDLWANLAIAGLLICLYAQAPLALCELEIVFAGRVTRVAVACVSRLDRLETRLDCRNTLRVLLPSVVEIPIERSVESTAEGIFADFAEILC